MERVVYDEDIAARNEVQHKTLLEQDQMQKNIDVAQDEGDSTLGTRYMKLPAADLRKTKGRRSPEKNFDRKNNC